MEVIDYWGFFDFFFFSLRENWCNVCISRENWYYSVCIRVNLVIEWIFKKG